MNIISAVYCEAIKIRRSKVFWFSFLLFAAALAMMSFGIEPRNWESFFDRFLALAANMGLVGSFFISSWVFGREFTDKTNKDLVAKPVSRETVVFSKYIIIFIWCIIFMLFIYLFSLMMGLLLGFTGYTPSLIPESLPVFILTFLFYIFLSAPGAFFASISKGILAPIGILFIIAIAANILGNTEAAVYFPWTIPTVFRETGSLIPASIVIMILTGAAGIIGTFAWWRFAEQG